MWWTLHLRVAVLSTSVWKCMGFAYNGWHFSTEDCRRLQVIQNKVLRCKSKNFDYRTPTRELLNQTGDLSVHQLIAYHSLLTLARIFFNRKPDYLVTRFGLKKPNSEHVAPSRQLNSIQIYAKLSISRSGFSYRSAKLWNGLPEHLRKSTCMKKFKIEVKDWVRSFVPVKPEWRTQDEHPKILI